MVPRFLRCGAREARTSGRNDRDVAAWESAGEIGRESGREERTHPFRKRRGKDGAPFADKDWHGPI